MDKKNKDKKEQMTLAEALAKLPPNKIRIKFTETEKKEFQRTRMAEEISKEVGFKLGGKIYPGEY